MKPSDAINCIPLVNHENYPPEDTLPKDGLYQYLLQPSEEHDNQQHRTTDRIWSKGTYKLREVVEDPGNCVMYYLSDGPDRAFVSEELMLIPEDTELLPNYVQNWKYSLQFDRYLLFMNLFSLIELLFSQHCSFVSIPYLTKNLLKDWNRTYGAFKASFSYLFLK